MENHHFWWENQLQVKNFNSYVSLPEGNEVIQSLFHNQSTNQPGPAGPCLRRSGACAISTYVAGRRRDSDGIMILMADSMGVLKIPSGKLT